MPYYTIQFKDRGGVTRVVHAKDKETVKRYVSEKKKHGLFRKITVSDAKPSDVSFHRENIVFLE